MHLAFIKSLNFANSPSVLPTEYILGGVEKAISALPVEAPEQLQNKKL
jgi:hypothetical protein